MTITATMMSMIALTMTAPVMTAKMKKVARAKATKTTELPLTMIAIKTTSSLLILRVLQGLYSPK